VSSSNGGYVVTSYPFKVQHAVGCEAPQDCVQGLSAFIESKNELKKQLGAPTDRSFLVDSMLYSLHPDPLLTSMAAPSGNIIKQHPSHLPYELHVSRPDTILSHAYHHHDHAPIK
jgi:hypothetical protein